MRVQESRGDVLSIALVPALKAPGYSQRSLRDRFMALKSVSLKVAWNRQPQ